MLRHFYALLVVVVGWVIFRAENFHSACNYLCAMAGLGHAFEAQPMLRYATRLVLWVALIGSVCSTPWWHFVKTKIAGATAGRPAPQAIFSAAEALGILILFFFSMAWMAGETYNPFIYYRF